MMYRQLTEQAEKYLRSLYQQDDIAGQLKRKLADLMARGEANADAACRALQLSRRTLQRRLKAEKTSFQKVLTEVRAELAVNYLKDARLKSLEVAMCRIPAEVSRAAVTRPPRTPLSPQPLPTAGPGPGTG
jgi:AraC-like DNA-binding protein